MKSSKVREVLQPQFVFRLVADLRAEHRQEAQAGPEISSPQCE